MLIPRVDTSSTGDGVGLLNLFGPVTDVLLDISTTPDSQTTDEPRPGFQHHEHAYVWKR